MKRPELQDYDLNGYDLCKFIVLDNSSFIKSASLLIGFFCGLGLTIIEISTGEIKTLYALIIGIFIRTIVFTIITALSFGILERIHPKRKNFHAFRKAYESESGKGTLCGHVFSGKFFV